MSIKRWNWNSGSDDRRLDGSRNVVALLSWENIHSVYDNDSEVWLEW